MLPYKKFLIGIFCLSSLITLLSLTLSMPQKDNGSGGYDVNYIQKIGTTLYRGVGICSQSMGVSDCVYQGRESVSDPLLAVFLSFTVLALLFIFLRKEITKVWLVSSLFFLPLLLIIIFNTSINNGGFDVGTGFSRDMVAIFLAATFFIISLLIILLTYLILWFKNRNADKKPAL